MGRGVCGRGRRTGSQAFTLLEILVVVAIIGLLSSVLIVGTAALLRQKPASGEEVVWKAISEARKYALLNNREVRLSYEAKEKRFTASTVDGAQQFPVDIPGELLLEFLPGAVPSGSYSLVGGSLFESRTVPFVTFYGDGTCSPFRVQIRTGQSGEARTLAIDPWTCAPMLPEKKT